MRVTRSIGSRLLASVLAGSSVVLLLSMSLVYVLIRRDWIQQLDASLVAEARAVAALCDADADGVECEAAAPDPGQDNGSAGPAFYGVWSNSGVLIARLAGSGSPDLEFEPPASNKPHHSWAQLAGGRRARVVRLAADLPPDEESPPAAAPFAVVVALGRDASGVLRALARLRFVLAGAWLVSGLVLAAILTWATRRGLAPLVELAQKIGALDETGLAQSVALRGPVPMEVEPLVGSLRAMLARLAAAFTRERTLVSNVAHELRTPLAGLRTTLEVALLVPGRPADTREDYTRCLSMVTDMQTMVENLLELARIESGQSPVRLRPADVGGLLRECWQPFEPVASERGLSVSWDLAGAAALGDEEKLRIAFRNLFANATTYADPGGCVRVETRIAGNRLLARIANSGCPLSPEQAELVFDRFWRDDASRSGDGAHCGLGMPLARQIVELLGGTIAVRCERGGEFVVEILLPLAQQVAADRLIETPPGETPGKEKSR